MIRIERRRRHDLRAMRGIGAACIAGLVLQVVIAWWLA